MLGTAGRVSGEEMAVTVYWCWGRISPWRRRQWRLGRQDIGKEVGFQEACGLNASVSDMAFMYHVRGSFERKKSTGHEKVVTCIMKDKVSSTFNRLVRAEVSQPKGGNTCVTTWFSLWKTLFWIPEDA